MAHNPYPPHSGWDMCATGVSNPCPRPRSNIPVVRKVVRKKDPSLCSLLHEPIFMMQAAEYGSFHNSVAERQEYTVCRINIQTT